MTVGERIHQELQKLPEPLQQEVLEFVEYLRTRAQAEDDSPEAEESWSSMSLRSALRGMESEDGPEYTTEDLKERFS